ncbi:auxilin-like protein, partial [Trifolium medium]|nr:auxilin-like protein [Trifolium medium]
MQFVVESFQASNTDMTLFEMSFFNVLKCTGVSVKKEAPVNFLTGPLKGRSTLRSTDVLVY